MQTNACLDVAIVGAGAAGLAAASVLSGHAVSALVLEARDRLGGRALTRRLACGLCFDVGCEWLHTADQNVLVRIARDHGFEFAYDEPHWGEQSFGINFPIAEQREFHLAAEMFETRLENAAQLAQDRAASDYLDPQSRWNPLIDAVSTYVNGTELSNVSVQDTMAYCDTDVNWRLHRGYGTLIAELGWSCNVALETEVLRIDHSGREIVLETSRGSIRARTVICTIPTNLIAAEAVRFFPPLSNKVAAAAGLPLGNAEKAMLYLGDPEILPADGHLFGATNRTQTGSYDLRPLGRPCIQAFFGGELARQLVEQRRLFDFAIDELVRLLGSSVRGKIRPLAASGWTADRFSQGSYSHALPGCAGLRPVLAEPVDGRLFFAGEATSPNFFSTAHGAYQTGLRAAAEVARALDLLPSAQ